MWGSATFPWDARRRRSAGAARPYLQTGAWRAGGAADRKSAVAASPFTGFTLTFQPKERFEIPV